MTLEEAIKLQEELLTLLPEVGFNKYMVSTRLGSEAMKRLQDYRRQGLVNPGRHLPGETEE